MKFETIFDNILLSGVDLEGEMDDRPKGGGGEGFSTAKMVGGEWHPSKKYPPPSQGWYFRKNYPSNYEISSCYCVLVIFLYTLYSSKPNIIKIKINKFYSEVLTKIHEILASFSITCDHKGDLR